MARKKGHEEHANHEAWAIPYGDLVTLLLALFVVLYSMSSVNEGKYRVLSDSLNEAFGGKPRAATPIQIGRPDPGHAAVINLAPKPAAATQRKTLDPRIAAINELQRMSDQVQAAMGDLIDKKLIRVRRTELALEIEIGSDILFRSGVADISASARPVLLRLAEILKPFPNDIRVEGHTDDVPIATFAYPSNWQLSSARAASVVSLFTAQGVTPMRMSVAGFGEYRPLADNGTADGRNQNRRVLIVIPRTEGAAITTAIDPPADADPVAESSAEPAVAPLAQPLGPVIDPALGNAAAVSTINPSPDQEFAVRSDAAALETSP